MQECVGEMYESVASGNAFGGGVGRWLGFPFHKGERWLVCL